MRRIIMGVAAVLLAPLVTAGNPSGATETTGAGDTYVVYAGHGIAVIDAGSSTSGCSRVYVTSDFRRFTEITPARAWRNPSRYGGSCIWVAYQASFVSAADGWLLARNGGSTTTVLAHTTDGGQTWTREPGGDTGSNGGGETIGFTSARDGWRQQIAGGSNAPFVLQHTSDAGASWSTVSTTHYGNFCAHFDPFVFSSPSLGFASNDGPRAWRTVDGGAIWTRFGLPRPHVVPATAHAYYGVPDFEGLQGAIPVTYLVGADQEVAFFQTTDGGLSWSTVGVARARDAVHPVGPQSACPGLPQLSGPLVLTSASAPDAWWLLRPGPAGASVVLTVRLTDRGVRVVGHLAGGLPTVSGPGVEASLVAADPVHACLTVTTGGTTAVYVTSNAGAAWHRVTLRA